MSYVTAALYEVTDFIVLAIGSRARFANVAPDTVLLIARDDANDDSSGALIAEHVHEIGAMAVIA